MSNPSYSVGLVSLGCVKNLVDSEAILGELRSEGFEIIPAEDGPDAVIINTCGFLQSARKEGTDTIAEFLRQKQKGTLRALIVTGCLTQRYRETLPGEFPEVDGFFGVGDFLEIPKFLKRRLTAVSRSVGHLISRATTSPLLKQFQRVLSTPSYAYLKVSEGCSRRCSFCAIPAIRGRMQSRPIDAIIDEAEGLLRVGRQEIILLGQDLTSYGKDLSPKVTLTDLLKALISVDGLRWLRLLYNYPHHIDKSLVRLIASEDKIVNYFDVPFQHISDTILKAMNRPESSEDIRTLLHQLRSNIPGIAIRTTLMVGFPGESDADFSELKAFVQDSKFDHLGVFAYSNEMGTNAYEHLRQIPEEIKEQRRAELMELQYTIVEEANRKRIGQAETVIIDAEASDEAGNQYLISRLYSQAPDVDSCTLIRTSKHLEIGSFQSVRIIDSAGYDLLAEPLNS